MFGHSRTLFPYTTLFRSGPGSDGSEQFTDISPVPNLEPDMWSGSAQVLNLGPNFGQVRKSSGPNLSSEPDYGIPSVRPTQFKLSAQARIVGGAEVIWIQI